MYGLGSRRFSETTGQDLVSCRRSAQNFLAPLGIVDNNGSESPPRRFAENNPAFDLYAYARRPLSSLVTRLRIGRPRAR
jgi:hypothetical protein